jgi:hypothetical protein
MRKSEWLSTTVSPATKQRVQDAAKSQHLAEAAWLRQVIESKLEGVVSADRADVIADRADVIADEFELGRRISVRLLAGDRLLLRERATARGTAPATYVSILIRSHLRQLTPLPKDELRAFREQVRELRRIGRNINQIARALNQQGIEDASIREDLRSFLKVATAMREATRALLKANSKSWETGHAPE